jgi:DNA-binding response OmpR family regulator
VPDALEVRPRVLLVEDGEEFVAMLVPLLSAEGYDVVAEATGEGGVERARELDPTIVLLDVLLPDIGGFEVCRRIRAFSDAYIVMLTSKSEEVDKVVGLTVGADDYVTKPFSPRELLARLEALLRRPRIGGDAAPDAPKVVQAGEVAIDLAAREVRARGDVVPLTRIEFDLLATLASRLRMVFSRQQLRERVWGPDWYGDDHAVDVHIANLRKKLAACGQRDLIRTVRGVGYRIDG